ncbi:flavin monoamine oxidase family protein [Rhodococcus sp. NPDC057014]|uniref:flavin monoamine oxidase family protein n=1 Tax=Rhodococcus sp. NPDC057014 TaxID=3346000 RepID=UPI00362FD3FC
MTPHATEFDYDVIVVGAGFAGATVARECATRGLRTVVLEGRDRIGGRVWNSQLSNGDPIDLGGTFVHWSQAHTWAEISRYGLTGDVVEANAAPADWVLASRGDGLEWYSAQEHYDREKPLLEKFFEPSIQALPRPYDPLYAADAVAELDQMTVRDRLDQLDLAPDDEAHLSALLSTLTADAPEKSSFMSLLRWWAAVGHGYDELWSVLATYKLKHGMTSLLGAILGDGGAEVRLSSPVQRIISEAESVEVTLTNGETVTGKAVVVATPSGVWPYLEFSPPLSSDRLDGVRAGMQSPRGSKGVVVLKGESRRFSITSRPGDKIALMWTSHHIADDEQVALFYCSPAMHDPDDAEEISAAIRDLLPGVVVGEVHSGSWGAGDEFTRGGWAMLPPGQLTARAPHETLTKPEGRVVFASGEIASFWTAFIDGAIESGLRAARDVQGILR